MERRLSFQSCSTLVAIWLNASRVSAASRRLPEDESIKVPSTTAVNFDSPAIAVAAGDEDIALILSARGEAGYNKIRCQFGDR